MHIRALCSDTADDLREAVSNSDIYNEIFNWSTAEGGGNSDDGVK